ncbi:MAG: two-component system cell cycle response regulator [Planctomycetota bacterium]|jgi:two-component system cell cycle response regulator
MINKTFAELRTNGKLPSPSGVGMQILRLTQGDDFSTEEIGQAISADSSLTGRLLKLANSAESGALEPITTIGEATIRLGIRTVRNLALGLSLVASNRSGACAEFPYDKYWSMSLARAVAGQQLSSALKHGVPAEMYILGLLADVGSLSLASSHPEHYGGILDDSSLLTLDDRCAAEQERFEINHREIASCMLLDWGLPKKFADAAKTYESCDLSELKDRIGDIPELLKGADLLARICCATEETTAAEWAEWAAEYAELSRLSGFDSEGFDRTCNSIKAEWCEWGEVLGIPTGQPIDFSKINERASMTADVSATKSAELAVTQIDQASDTFNESSLRVLAIDDDPVSLKILVSHLTAAGHHVSTAKDGEDALRMVLQDSPQLVIADWKMPRLNGVELCRALRKISSGQKIYFLLLTGTDDEESVIKAFGMGIDDYITKPFNPRILLARLNAGKRIVSLQQQIEQEKSKQQRQMMDLQILTRKLRSAALTDPLTELPNRRYAMKRLAQSWESSTRTGDPVSVIMMDIDHFKAVNDNFGHDAGDEVLKEAARTLSGCCREDEDVCRIGGEEFLVVCTNTSSEDVVKAAERLRVAVETAEIFWNGEKHKVTMSFGVCTRTDEIVDYEMLMKASDEAVYVAKESGRNRVVVSERNALGLKKSA